MNAVLPAFAVVRPRAIAIGSSGARPLNELVAEIADAGGHGVVYLTGPPGAGKSTALAHLAATFAHNERVVFADDATEEELQSVAGEHDLVIASAPLATTRRSDELRLAPWGLDELIEYLLARRHDQCRCVIQRLGPAARRRWSPQLAVIVLDRLAANPLAQDATAELCAHIDEALASADLSDHVRRFCLAMLVAPGPTLANQFIPRLNERGFASIGALLKHATVQIPLAAQCIVRGLETHSTADLQNAMPRELVDALGQSCRENRNAREELHRVVDSSASKLKHSMAASILFAVDRAWRPPDQPTADGRSRPAWHLARGFFSGAQWPRADFSSADLSNVDLSDADLSEAVLSRAALYQAQFDRANLAGADLTLASAAYASFDSASLRGARLVGAALPHADFAGADVADANLKNAKLTYANLASASLAHASLIGADLFGARLADADFTGATLIEANLGGCDFRTARLRGANMERADLSRAQLEDVSLPHARLHDANLREAHLTGSHMPDADLRGANLYGCGLAEINWEGADLRGANLKAATFHMGSSRSGLVDSPLACEGSKTGFYTDDYEDMHFKRPEDVRKANLCAADLRGANIADLDFYLVDLRGARLDQSQLAHVRKCGAILEDVVA